VGKLKLLQGNEACTEGALYAGCTFFAGYPITPSTEVAEYMARTLPKIGGAFLQMEDEIAAMAAVIGGSLAGCKTLTATSGPGFSLKQENLGFAAGNNQGIKKASGEYILTLNNDTVLGKGFFGALAAVAERSSEDTGMWAVKILSFDEQVVIDSVGGLLIYPDGLARGKGRLEIDTGQYDQSGAAFIPSACAGLYRRAMLEEVGLFDEDFFAYCEDTDLGLRARLAGWNTVSVPGAVVYHHYSGTGGRYTPFKAYLVERNRIWVALKNFHLRFLLHLPF
jgi:GT2 family glycosyltransferase